MFDRGNGVIYEHYPIIILIPYRESPVLFLNMGVFIVTYDNSPIQPKTAVKVQALRQSGTFNPVPAIRDRLFLEERFFDPRT